MLSKNRGGVRFQGKKATLAAGEDAMTNGASDMPSPAPVASILPAVRGTPINDELGALRDIVLGICPAEASVAFSFTDRLRLTIDVRTLEEVAALETLLPGIAGGVLTGVTRGATPGHSFRRRLTANVER